MVDVKLDNGTVLLDLDDTLVQTESVALGACYNLYKTEVAPELGLSAPSDFRQFVEESRGKTFRTIITDACKEQEKPIPAQEKLDDFARREMQAVLAAFRSESLPAVEGVSDMLESFVRVGIDYHIVTSSHQLRAIATVNGASLDGYFSQERGARLYAAQGGEYKGQPKPDPGIYNYALEKHSLDPKTQRVLALEDSPTGVKAGVAANIPVIGNMAVPALHGTPELRREALLEAGAICVVADIPTATRLITAMLACNQRIRDIDLGDLVQSARLNANGEKVWLPQAA